MSALAPLGHQPSLLGCEVAVVFERGVDVGVGDEVRALVKSLDEPGTDAVLHAEHLHGGEQLLVPFSERDDVRSEEHTSELQSLMRISYAVFCLKKNTK